MKDMNPLKKAHQHLNKINKSKSTHRYIRKKPQNTRVRQKVLKSTREKKTGSLQNNLSSVKIKARQQ